MGDEDWSIGRRTDDSLRAGLARDWSAGSAPPEAERARGVASQSRVSFLLSVFHCVFKLVIYDPD